MPRVTEDKLIEAAAKGDHSAFQVLMRSHVSSISAYLYSRISSEQDREDLIQEIFINAYIKLGSLRQKDRFRSWLLALARNALHDFYRRKNSSARAGLSDQFTVPDVAEITVDYTQDPAGSAERQELEEILKGLLRRQKDKYRTVLYLRLFEERTSREIAELLELKESTVRVRLKRGLAALQASFRKRGVVP